jgi:hypothetical protein
MGYAKVILEKKEKERKKGVKKKWTSVRDLKNEYLDVQIAPAL